MRRIIRSLTCSMLVLAGLALMPLSQPEAALADDATVTTCDEAGFDAALASVQSSGGGIIRFDCSGTIIFTSQKEITTNVAIFGGNSIIFEGVSGIRLFHVGNEARLALFGLTLDSVSGNVDFGGAIFNDGGSLYIVSSTINGNAQNRDGAIYNNGGSVAAIDSTIRGDISFGRGGGIYNDGGSLWIAASTLNRNDGGNEGGGAIFSAGGTSLIVASTFVNNDALSTGGAIFYEGGAHTLISSTFEENTTMLGAGAVIMNSGTSELTINASVFRANSTRGNAGAIFNSTDATLIIKNSTFADNEACTRGGVIVNRGTLEVSRSTFNTNSVLMEHGGAIYNFLGTATITASTFVDNRAGWRGGAIANEDGTITSLGYNLSDDVSCNLSATGDRLGQANLGELADNGGQTQTMLPKAGSAAIDAIPPAECETLSTSRDQRGVARPQGTNCEIGAVELEE